MVHAEDDCHQFLSFRFKFWCSKRSQYIVLTRDKLNLAEITDYFDSLLHVTWRLPYLAFICSSNFELLFYSVSFVGTDLKCKM
jgi:hypothetical protein